jgi:hypothetical protein
MATWLNMNRAHFHVSLKARSGTFPGAKQIRAKPPNRGNRPVTRDPEKLPARLPATREFAAASLSLNFSARAGSFCGPTRTTWAVQQVVGYLGYSG